MIMALFGQVCNSNQHRTTGGESEFMAVLDAWADSTKHATSVGEGNPSDPSWSTEGVTEK